MPGVAGCAEPLAVDHEALLLSIRFSCAESNPIHIDEHLVQSLKTNLNIESRWRRMTARIATRERNMALTNIVARHVHLKQQQELLAR